MEMSLFSNNNKTMFNITIIVYSATLIIGITLLSYLFDSPIISITINLMVLILICSAYYFRCYLEQRERKINESKILEVHENYKKSQFYRHLVELEQELSIQENKIQKKLDQPDGDISFAIHEPYPNLKKHFENIPFNKKQSSNDSRKLNRDVREQFPQIIKSFKSTKDSSKFKNIYLTQEIAEIKEPKHIDFSKPSFVYKKQPVKPEIGACKLEKPKKENVSKSESLRQNLISKTEEKNNIETKQPSQIYQPFKTDKEEVYSSTKTNLFANIKTEKPSQPIETKDNEPQILKVNEPLLGSLLDSSQIDFFASTQPQNLLSNKSDLKAMETIKEEDSTNNMVREDEPSEEVESKKSIKSFTIQELDFEKLAENKAIYDKLRQLKISIPSDRTNKSFESINEFFGKICCNIDEHFVQQCLKLAEEFKKCESNEGDYYYLIYELVLKLFTETRSRFASSKINIVR